ncbi:fused response regulator/phosphatase [Chromobacterium violaceum]|uniref:fused response regulator/phosphatase n=1 Tax=Chromobacterium violaceum TaxID=536 RepID=UPI0009D93563|nr:fused response regulator/phosphatase [Chromobacterium violaceum]OQS48967.1 hypothetical protein B0T48_08475 [Chromobacterium violaceum]OQS51491.1 hypothetical protein B0T49_10220 [Chromobacterium violaceum]QRO33731.1 fused response regulator/phosphatase [Chromobacterium violaceum]QRQ16465.1 fused response regulator/phosphatase [Chromobacterium violaceum]
MDRTFTVLVAEDVEPTRLLMGLVIEEMGHQVWYAENGQQAVEQCRRELPDMVLMDMMMPVMDGHEATRQIRQLCGDRWLPIIFLSARSDEEAHISSLDVGADDYLPKPINLTMLAAKIRVMQRISEMQRRISDDSQQLVSYYHSNEREQLFAKHVLDSIVGSEEQDLPGVYSWQQSAEQFSGDVLARALSPTGQLCVMLADSTGHGLSAALSCLPAVDIFYAMARRGFPLTSMAREINAKLNRLLPVGRFVAAALITIDWELGCVEVWNGGIPCVMFVDDEGCPMKEWKSQYPPLGILSPDEFCWGTEAYFWEQSGQLVVCSDGLTEAENRAGEQFGIGGLLQALIAGPSSPLNNVRSAVLGHLGGANNRDDISLGVVRLEAGVNAALDRVADHLSRDDGGQLSTWKVTLAFSAEELKRDQSITLLIGWLNQLGFRGRQFKEALLIVSELFNNALDHGVLGLDSTMKDQADGYERYFMLRRERLGALERAEIELTLERRRGENDGDAVRIRIRDSGGGFDHPTLMEKLGRQAGGHRHGRGVSLVHALCLSLVYHGSGNEVEAEFRL